MGVALLQVYNERVLSIAVNCARQAAKMGARRFVHFSTAQVYDCDKVVIATNCQLNLHHVFMVAGAQS